VYRDYFRLTLVGGKIPIVDRSCGMRLIVRLRPFPATVGGRRDRLRSVSVAVMREVNAAWCVGVLGEGCLGGWVPGRSSWVRVGVGLDRESSARVVGGGRVGALFALGEAIV